MRSSAVALFVACWLTSIRLSLSNLVLLRRAIHRSDDLYRNREAEDEPRLYAAGLLVAAVLEIPAELYRSATLTPPYDSLA
jgi:hypothetical protein